MRKSDRRLLRASLAAVWLGTAGASIATRDTVGAVLLAEDGLPATWHAPVLWGGAAADALIGLLLLAPRRSGLLLAGALLAGWTLAATLLLPGLWLHPLGPLLKNLPIAAVLWVLWKATP